MAAQYKNLGVHPGMYFCIAVISRLNLSQAAWYAR